MHSTFIEVAYLLIHGELPTKDQLGEYVDRISKHAMIHEDMKLFFEGFSKTAHPMVILSSMVSSLSAYYTEASGKASIENLEINSARLIAKIGTIAAFSYKKSVGQPFVYPKDDLTYCANFLNMMFSVPAEPYEIDPEIINSLELMLILHADHEQNCSASTVRVVGSSMANVYASVASGILALWGPLHGGANQQAVQMLQQIYEDGSNISVESEKVIIATGSKPSSIPGVQIDKQRIITSTEALKLAEIPKKMVVIGGGIIGLELGSVYSRLGTEVQVVEYLSLIHI